MTGNASRGKGCVLIVEVTGSACDRGVLSGQRESRGGVIKRRSRPLRRGMAQRTILREPCCGVIRTGGALVFRQMAGNTGRWERGVLSAGMALGATQSGMFTCQRESGSGVVERRPRPLSRRVTKRAVCRKSGGRMIRASRRLILCQVTGHAGCSQRCVLIVHVAGSAYDRGVFSGERESSRCIVIESCSGPLSRGVTGRAVRRESRGGVIRSLRVLEGC